MSELTDEKKGCAWPGDRWLSRVLKCSLKSLYNARERLKERGWLRVTPVFLNNERVGSRYYLAWDRFDEVGLKQDDLVEVEADYLESQRRQMPLDRKESSEGSGKNLPDGAEEDSRQVQKETPANNTYSGSLDTKLKRETPDAGASGSTGPVLNSSPASQPQAENDNWPTDAFDQFWAIYPDKTGKAYARTLLSKIEKRGDVRFETVIDGIRRYVKNKPKDRAWCHPSTFINQERWDDEPANDGYETLHQKARAMTKVSI
ncbi:hypothetical protein [Bradyrhizobium sp. G127]|uniref:hypothetical protein n=1 Tax=Bradyrhizobium sp. G127 TaxID=2904800 RepID=UPI001F411FD4|nr:hypothetical protein [Bradyrhizobium sp. G127]MCF2522397.1 hypothetical protein [Bradyrhizobium sp. G127]